MRYYFAGAYARRAELAGRAMELEMAIASAKVVSGWLIDDQAGSDDAGFCVEMLHLDSVAAKAWEYGRRDIDDVCEADAVVSFTGEGTRGRRHIEHGFAMMLHQCVPDLVRLIVVGPREHVFHCHPATEVYPDFAAFLKHEIDRA